MLGGQVVRESDTKWEVLSPQQFEYDRFHHVALTWTPEDGLTFYQNGRNGSQTAVETLHAKQTQRKMNIVTCQAHPALVKRVQSTVRCFFILGSYY